MVDDAGVSPAFPVSFFDGEREMDIGDVRINPAMDYKSFQLMLSEKIGISPNQISIYLVNRKRSRKSSFSDDRRRIPITGKANFGAICRQKECCFLVVLKRSRKSRSRRERMIGSGDFARGNESSSPAPERLILLRRSQPSSFCDRVVQSEVDGLNGQLRELGVRGDAKSPLLIGDSFPAIDSTWLVMKRNEEKRGSCEECTHAEKNGGTVSFHPCINDAVITRFTTRLGPINRPNKCF
ncbi:hypothetical protein C2S51_035398 [Perilla frutescens var. frutescens]|nr:hypothetical protein C2S51_035398 [Perilla frutescens var. frutescens]